MRRIRRRLRRARFSHHSSLERKPACWEDFGDLSHHRLALHHAPWEGKGHVSVRFVRLIQKKFGVKECTCSFGRGPAAIEG